MKISQIINWFRSGRITLIMLIIVAFWLPLSKSILPALMALTLISFLVQKKRKISFRQILNEKFLILLIVFYGLHIVSLTYSDELNKGLFDLEVKLSLLIFPIIFLFLKLNDLSKIRNKMFNAFILGNVAASVICIIIAFYNSIKNGNSEFINISLWLDTRDWPVWKLLASGYSYFNYTWLSYFHHPSYFGMYLVFAAYLSWHILKRSLSELSTNQKAFYIISILFFVVMIFLLQSRAAILTLIIVTLFEVGRSFLNKERNFTVKLIIAFLAIGLILVLILSNERFRFYNNTEKDISEIEIRKTNIRIEIWNKSFEIIKENLLFGVGVGDVKNELIKSYNTESLKEARAKGYNAHNQFIETFIGLGLIGLIILLLILFLPLFEKLYSGDHVVTVIFLLIIVTGFIFESMLNTIAGVSFLGYFYSLLNRNEIAIDNEDG